MIQPSLIDLLWNTSYVFKTLPPCWSGYMSKVSSNEVLQKSIAIMLPIINFHATDMNALYSFLSFMSNWCRKLNVWLTVIRKSIWKCLAYEYEHCCLSQRIPLIDKFPWLYWMCYGRMWATKCPWNCIYSNKCGSYVNMKDIFKDNPGSILALAWHL